MRKLMLKITGFLVGMLFAQLSYAQCDSDDFLDNCASQLDTYTFIKAFNTALKPGPGSKQEMSYVFSKGSEYILVSCDQNNKGGKMVVSLFDRTHKLVASTYSAQMKRHFPSLVFPCMATGVYYIEFKFEADKGGCGVGILGFSKK